jgi:hypothetical protein
MRSVIAGASILRSYGATMLRPIEQSGLVGLNLTLDISEAPVGQLDRTPGLHPFLREKVDGNLDMNTGEGFRRRPPGQTEKVHERRQRVLVEQTKSKRSRPISMAMHRNLQIVIVGSPASIGTNLVFDKGPDGLRDAGGGAGRRRDRSHGRHSRKQRS